MKTTKRRGGGSCEFPAAVGKCMPMAGVPMEVVVKHNLYAGPTTKEQCQGVYDMYRLEEDDKKKTDIEARYNHAGCKKDELLGKKITEAESQAEFTKRQNEELKKEYTGGKRRTRKNKRKSMRKKSMKKKPRKTMKKRATRRRR